MNIHQIRYPLSFTVHSYCRETSEKNKSAFQSYREIVKVNWGIQNRQLSQMYKAIFVPTVAYGAGAWANHITKAGLFKLIITQRAALITVTRAYCTISTPALPITADVASIEHELQKESLEHGIRNGSQVTRVGGVDYDPALTYSGSLRCNLKDRQLQSWQVAWENDTKGRATFDFFHNIAERKRAVWVEPTYYITQFPC